jgi:hypothetical protein
MREGSWFPLRRKAERPLGRLLSREYEHKRRLQLMQVVVTEADAASAQAIVEYVERS